MYLNSTDQSNLYPNITVIQSGKEEISLNQKSDVDHRYITRVKSSNAENINNWSSVKDRTLRQTSKTNKILKNLSEVQFETELYWNGNSSYLVTGVKNQYEKMKKSKIVIISFRL